MDLISTSEAAKRKGISRQAIVNAIKREVIDGQQVSERTIVVLDNEKFREWVPNSVRQAAGRSPRKTGRPADEL